MRCISVQLLVASLVLAIVGQAHACDDACAVSVDQIAGYTYSATLQQTGASNRIDLKQSQGSQSANLSQRDDQLNATGNAAKVVQSGPAGNVLIGVQIGDGNSMTVNQYASTSPNQAGIAQIGAGNGATLQQTGSDEVAAFTQLGANNTATVTQSGSGDVAVATQTGSGDTMSIAQSGADDHASYTQLGDNLKDIKISQTGPNASVSVVQTAFGTFK